MFWILRLNQISLKNCQSALKYGKFGDNDKIGGKITKLVKNLQN